MWSALKGAFKRTNDKELYLRQSHSQSGEDLLVDFVFKEIGITAPSYLDIGAHHPYYLNNTAIFYERGCRGINIEPDPDLFSSFEISRKRDVNLNIGIGEKKGSLDFYQISSPTLNTFSKKEAESYTEGGDYTIKKVIPVKVDTVHNVLERYNKGKFPDFLSLDAEGLDDLILRSIGFEEDCPKIICVETLTFSSNGRGVKNNGLISFLETNGYLLYADTNINSIFVRKDLWIR